MSTMTQPEAPSAKILDALIIGGGPAGLSAALYLGRSRRDALVLDAGDPRHAVVDATHNFLTRDGLPPAALRSTAWEQLAAYPSVTRGPQTRVHTLKWRDDLWHATSEAGKWRARAVVLALGVVDEHPDLPGFEACWGDTIQHCPFCHGWELRDRPLAVLVRDAHGAHLARMVRGWSDDVIVLTHGQQLPPDACEALAEARIPLDTRPIAALEAEGSKLQAIVLDDGERLARLGLFVQATQRQTPLVTSLGLELSEAGFVVVDAQQRTSLPMLWAAGDMTTQMQQIVAAAAQGATAGAMIQATLLMS